MRQIHAKPPMPKPTGDAFNEIFLSSSSFIVMSSERSWQPPTDVYETDTEIVIRVEIAGIKPEEVTISFDGDTLSIKGVRDELISKEQCKRVFRQMEINYGKFERVIVITGAINAEKAHAAYQNGFLEIVIPKAKQKKTIAHIEIMFRAS